MKFSFELFQYTARILQLEYLPFGEDYIYQRNSSWNIPYTFSGKEKDAETGYSYFGARYYDSDLSVWLSVDPLASMYPSTSPFMYVRGNPVMLVDPNGMYDDPAAAQKAQEKAGKKYGPKNVGNVYKKENGDYAFRISKNGFKQYSQSESKSLGLKGDAVANGGIEISNNKEWRNYKKNDGQSKVADFIRNTPWIPTGISTMPIGFNPLYQAEAVSVDLGINVVGAEVDAGFYFPLTGDQKGSFLSYHEHAGGVGTDGSFTFEFGRSDYTGNLTDFRSSMLYGERTKLYVGVNVLEFGSVGYGYSFSNVKGGQIRTHQVSVGVGAGIIPVVNGGFNEGEIKNW